MQTNTARHRPTAHQNQAFTLKQPHAPPPTPATSPLPRQTALHTTPFFLFGEYATRWGLDILFPDASNQPPHFPARLSGFNLLPVAERIHALWTDETTINDPDAVVDGTAVFPRTLAERERLETLARAAYFEVRSVPLQVWYNDWRVREYWGETVVWGAGWGELEEWREEVVRLAEERKACVTAWYRENVRPQVEKWLEGVEMGDCGFAELRSRCHAERRVGSRRLSDEVVGRGSQMHFKRQRSMTCGGRS